MRRQEQEITQFTAIRQILAKAQICRIAFHDDPYPYIVPLNFGYEVEEALFFYFHCAREGRKLDLLRRNNKVCFELETDTRILAADKACGWSMEYKSVIGNGTLEIIDDDEGKKHGLNVIMKHYSGKEHYDYQPGSFNRSLVLKLRVDSYSAKQHSRA